MDTTEQKLKGGIYVIVCNGNGKIYIGGSINVRKRIISHIAALNKIQHENLWLQSAWNIYGKEHFDFNIIEYCEEKAIRKKENFWLKETKSYEEENGFNIRGFSPSKTKCCFRKNYIKPKKEEIILPNGTKYYTVSKVATILKISDRTVYAYIRDKRIKTIPYRINRFLIGESDLKIFMQKYRFAWMPI